LSLAILYEYPETDEEGIKVTAQDMGIDLKYIPFRKISVLIGNGFFSFKSRMTDYGPLIEDVTAVLNRAQSKNRRLYSASILEGLGKYVVNPQRTESICFSKLRTLFEFWKNEIPFPKTVYVPCDSHDLARGGVQIHNEEAVADLVQQDLGNGRIVIKPDAGTHGKEVHLAQDRDSLIEFLGETEPSIINPVGIVAQEFIEKWFYDLRIVVTKEYGNPPYCHPTALARAGLKDFRTNTYLGNMVFGVKLPVEVQKTAERAAEAIGKDDAWVLALDAMVNVGEDRFVDDDYVKSEFEKLAPVFQKVGDVKQDSQGKSRDFRAWSRSLEAAFGAYMDEQAYTNIKRIIEESIERNKRRVLFHEANSCPEFWEQTRNIAGINLAISLLKCAKSVEGREPLPAVWNSFRGGHRER
jgi:glutathione synthase/RimK-type ligase-like ATP-grasp enzyme